MYVCKKYIGLATEEGAILLLGHGVIHKLHVSKLC